MKGRAAFPDARIIIIVVLLITTLAIAISDPAYLAGLLAAAIIALVISRISIFRLLKRLRRYRWLFFFLALAQSVTYPSGQVFLEWQGYTLLSSGGILAALAVLIRIMVILAAALLLTLKDSQQLVTGLVQMRVPYELAYMVLLGIRFIPVLMEEFRDALIALQLRGIDINRIPLREKIKVYSYILMPTVAGALIRARRIATAMEARAFRAENKRTWLDWPRMTRLDWLVMVAAVASWVGIILINRGVIL